VYLLGHGLVKRGAQSSPGAAVFRAIVQPRLHPPLSQGVWLQPWLNVLVPCERNDKVSWAAEEARGAAGNSQECRGFSRTVAAWPCRAELAVSWAAGWGAVGAGQHGWAGGWKPWACHCSHRRLTWGSWQVF